MLILTGSDPLVPITGLVSPSSSGCGCCCQWLIPVMFTGGVPLGSWSCQTSSCPEVPRPSPLDEWLEQGYRSLAPLTQEGQILKHSLLLRVPCRLRLRLFSIQQHSCLTSLHKSPILMICFSGIWPETWKWSEIRDLDTAESTWHHANSGHNSKKDFGPGSCHRRTGTLLCFFALKWVEQRPVYSSFRSTYFTSL